MNKPKLYLTTSSFDLNYVQDWIARIRAAGFETFDWTANPNWENPTHENLKLAIDCDLNAVCNCEIFWWQLNGKSEGAAFEAGYAMGILKAMDQIALKKWPLLVVSGHRINDPRSLFAMHENFQIRCLDHEVAWFRIRQYLAEQASE